MVILQSDLGRQRLFLNELQEKLSEVLHPDDMLKVRELREFGETNVEYYLFVDKKLNFYLQKSYINSNNECNINREKRIFSSDYSKFIIHITNSKNDKIILPYFSMRAIKSFFIRSIELSISDKLVMILEIATALKGLHSNKEYHGNLSNCSIFINSDRDAYIGSIFHDESYEKQMTKLPEPFYYRPPEKFYDNNQEDKNPESEEFIQKQQKGDIYSFGVLMHEIITETSPKKRMDDDELTREKRTNIMKNKYKEFLFQENNDKFDETKDHNMNDMKTIIEKCLEKDPTKRLNAEKIIDLIKKTTTYGENKEEIATRISKSKASQEYQCTISDIIKSYYEGQEDCSNDIIELLNKNEQLSSTDDKSILSIQNNNNNIIDFTDQLFCFSLESNSNQECNNIPVSTLGNFIKFNKYKIGHLIPTWIYFISKELSLIHSINLYHGKLSMDSIGIYYNHETQTFNPSIILFYSIYKQNLEQNQLYSYHDPAYSEESINEKYQKKDLKKLLEIIKILCEININQFKLNSNNIINEIEQADSVYEIVNLLYNFINSNGEQKKIFDKNKNFSMMIIRHIEKHIMQLSICTN